jgi:two-component system, OmpR family, sensor histidine kinase VicK
MRRLRRLLGHPSWILVASLGGLLVFLTIGGVAGVVVNQRVHSVAQQALRFDVQLEDRGDDLRVSVLDVRHYHRNIVFAGPSRGGLAAFDAAYLQLQSDIDAYEALGIADASLPAPDTLRSKASVYYTGFQSAIALRENDQAAFIAASDQGLIQIAELEQLATEIDRAGERRAEDALSNVERASRAATIDLMAVLLGLVIFGGLLAYLIARTANELNRLYATQQATSQQLAAALRAKNNFIADASHELRTPLTVLRGNAEVGLALDRDCVHAPILHEIVRESERMTRLVEDLLILARSDSSALPLELEHVDALALLAGVAEPATLLAQQHGVTLTTSIDGTGIVTVDARRIEQVILILVDNAVTYGGTSPITLASTSTEGDIVISVTDSGPGIPEEELPHIFERFYRVDKTRSRKLGGAGLGLAIARSIIEAHGGRIEAQSRVDAGTTIRVFLPRETDHFPDDAPAPDA